MINRYGNLAAASNALQERGFSNTYKLRGDRLYCFETNLTYSADEVKIVEYHRFAGTPKDETSSSVIFAFQANDGSRGTIMSIYSDYMNAQLAQFLSKTKILIRREQSQ